MKFLTRLRILPQGGLARIKLGMKDLIGEDSEGGNRSGIEPKALNAKAEL